MSLETLESSRAWLASGSCDRTVRIWSWTRGTCVRVLATEAMGEVLALRYMPALNWLATAGKENAISVFSMNSACLVRHLDAHTDWVQCLEVCGNGKWLVSGSNDKTLRVWTVQDGACVRTLQAHGSYVSSLAVASSEQSTAYNDQANWACSIS